MLCAYSAAGRTLRAYASWDRQTDGRIAYGGGGAQLLVDVSTSDLISVLAADSCFSVHEHNYTTRSMFISHLPIATLYITHADTPPAVFYVEPATHFSLQTSPLYPFYYYYYVLLRHNGSKTDYFLGGGSPRLPGLIKGPILLREGRLRGGKMQGRNTRERVRRDLYKLKYDRLSSPYSVSKTIWLC